MQGSSSRTIHFPELLRWRGEQGLQAAVHQAARAHRQTSSEYLRQTVRERLKKDGIRLPPLDIEKGESLTRGPSK